ncbi:MAG: YHYH protein [Cyanobacteria bacterium J06635_10]
MIRNAGKIDYLSRIFIAILSAYTIAAFDDCGGDINPVIGYHQHGINGCFGVESKVDGETKLVGYAMDGFPIHNAYEDSNQTPKLDECGGHEVEGIGYHYHANKAETNSVISCFHGTLVQGQQDERGGKPGRPPQGKRPPRNIPPRNGLPPSNSPN